MSKPVVEVQLRGIAAADGGFAVFLGNQELVAYPIPVLADPKKLVQALNTLRTIKSFPSPKAVNTTTPTPQVRFRRLWLP
jgi:hypothetical protein